MKCSVCGSENVIKINEEKMGKYNIEYYCCKNCYHVDSYCFDFKNNKQLEDKVYKLLDEIKLLRTNALGNKKDALRKFYDGVSLIRCQNPSNELTLVISSINKALKDIDEYLDVNSLMHKEEQKSYDEACNPVLKDVYFIGDFPVNYKDCTSGCSILFFKSKPQYNKLETVKNHTMETTVLDIMNEYFVTEAKNHVFYPLNEDIKNSEWYINSLNNDSLKDAIDMINNAIIELNK